MRRFLLLICVTALSLTSIVQAREEDTYDSVMKDMIAAFKGVCDVLESAKDEKTIEDARPKLKAAVKKMVEIKQRANKLGMPPQNVEAELMKKYGAMLREQGMRLVKESIRLQDDKLKGGKELLKELDELNKAPK